ncbi:hypothetical protein [uncultured Gemella sp.]|uniref:hypothetical protein n=1 Tax=uncultured Gemella sp. TaxID=254352 RepID=UPI0028E9BFDE|nr:hypothetical protein [uncultured Gemella sp.]
MSKLIDKLLKYSFAVLSFIIFIICLVGGLCVSYRYKLDVVRLNVYIFIVSVVFIVVILKIITLVGKFIKDRFKVNARVYVYLVSLVFMCFQIYLIHSYYFNTGWDSGRVIDAAYQLSKNIKLQESANEYFSYYPNNVLITILFSKIISFSNVIGLEEYSYFIILVVQSLINIATGILIFEIIEDLTKSNSLALLGYFIYIILIGLSPWVSIPYSDSMALIIPIIMFYLYIRLCNGYSKIINTFLIVFLAVFGYMLKPQTIIFFISCVVVSILFIKNYNLKNILKILILVVFLFGISYSSIKYFSSDENMSLNSELEISYDHFLKMGLNNSNDGGYSSNDVMDSVSYKTKEEREKANFKVIKERLKDYGVIGLFNHQVKKTLVNYNDGTFAWSREGTFYLNIQEKNQGVFSSIRNFYYENGKFHFIFKYVTQGIWLFVLFCLSLNGFLKMKYLNNNVRVLYLALIGLFIFESIFEARARYLYTYVPIFIVTAILGLKALIDKINK